MTQATERKLQTVPLQNEEGWMDRMKDRARALKARSRSAVGTSRDYVKEHPGQLVLASFATGVVLGFLLRRGLGARAARAATGSRGTERAA
jgi:ElaB/YqjD/DUF883 family membrane-anchored ribosome-binding protein